MDGGLFAHHRRLTYYAHAVRTIHIYFYIVGGEDKYLLRAWSYKCRTGQLPLNGREMQKGWDRETWEGPGIYSVGMKYQYDGVGT